MTAVRTTRLLGHLGRGAISIGGIFFNFSALARLPIVDATALSFTSPVITVAMAALFLKERVRIYRWSVVIVGFAGILVVGTAFRSGNARAGCRDRVRTRLRPCRRVLQCSSVIQTRRLTQTETISSIVFYFSLICAVAGFVTWRWDLLLPHWTPPWPVPTWTELVAFHVV